MQHVWFDSCCCKVFLQKPRIIAKKPNAKIWNRNVGRFYDFYEYTRSGYGILAGNGRDLEPEVRDKILIFRQELTHAEHN